MAVWTILAAPFLLSNDLARVTPDVKALLLNKEIIAMNQDSLGIQGLLVKTVNKIEVGSSAARFLIEFLDIIYESDI